MKRNNRGISLIVLVITVIVMIILAGSVIISLSNSGIIGKAKEAVEANNLKQVQQLASLAWSEAYIDRLTDSTVDLEARVEEALEKNKVDQDKYIINVTDNGVEVLEKTLGNLITGASDYGKKIDYTVTVNGTEHKDWRVLYEDEANGYVYIITTNSVGGPTIELIAAGWNAKGYEPQMTVGTGTYGYTINGSFSVSVTSDGLYVPSDYNYRLASTSNSSVLNIILAGYDNVYSALYTPVEATYGVRPVVCLSSNIPAVAGDEGNFLLVK